MRDTETISTRTNKTLVGLVLVLDRDIWRRRRGQPGQRNDDLQRKNDNLPLPVNFLKPLRIPSEIFSLYNISKSPTHSEPECSFHNDAHLAKPDKKAKKKDLRCASVLAVTCLFETSVDTLTCE